MGEYTKGPWEAIRHNTKFEIHSVDEIVAFVSLTRLPEDEANIRLIASAPELLEALQLIARLRNLDDTLLTMDAKYPTLGEYARAAIANGSARQRLQQYVETTRALVA